MQENDSTFNARKRLDFLCKKTIRLLMQEND